MHIGVIKLTTIGSDNGLLTGWCQAIISTNAGILLTRPLETNFSEIKIYTCSLKNCIWKSCVLHNERKLWVILFTLYKKHVSFHTIVRPSLCPCSTGRRCYCASMAYKKNSRYTVDTPHMPKDLHLRCGFTKQVQWSHRGAPGIRHVCHQILNMLKKIAVRSPSINYTVGAL